MDRYRLIAGMVACFIYLLAMFPLPTIICSLIIAIAYFILSGIHSDTSKITSNITNTAELRRLEALSYARLYLAPYSNIWKNLKLSNKFCSLRLQSNGRTIIGRETVAPYRTFRMIKSLVHSETDLWDMFCHAFDYNTTFDGLLELCRRYEVDIKIDGNAYTLSQGSNYSVSIENKNAEREIKIDISNDKTNEPPKEKLDINNASEVELTALPGVNIVLAKKIIKKREDIGGFKDVNSFLEFIQLKPHMQQQLRELICVNKMKGSIKIKRNSERSVDL